MLNEIVIDDNNNDQVDRYRQPDHDKDSIASVRTVHLNCTPVRHSTKDT